MHKNTKIFTINDSDIFRNTAEVLEKGGIIIYPTETLYGIGAFATYTNAINEIFNVKERARGKPFILLVKDFEMLEKYFIVPEIVLENSNKFIEEPITIIFNQNTELPEELSAGTKKIGVRISTNQFVKELFSFIDIPLVSTSANISGEENTNASKQIIELFYNKVDLIIDSGNLPHSNGSSLIDITSTPPRLLREGDITKEDLKEFLSGDY